MILWLCGSSHTAAHVMELLKRRVRVASKFQNRLVGAVVLV